MSHSNRVRHDPHYKQNESDSSHKHHTSQDRSEYCKPQHSFFRNHVSSAYEPLTQFNKSEIIGPERSAVQGHEYAAKKDTKVVTDVEQIVKSTELKENQLMSRLHETLNCYHNLPTIYRPPRRTSAEKHSSTFKEGSGERPSPRSLRSGYVKNSTHHTGLRTPTNKVLSNAHPNRPLDNEPSLCKTFAFTVFSNIPSRSQGTAFGTSVHEQHQICTTHVLFSSDPDRSPLVCDREGESQSDVRSLQMYRHRCMLQKECLHTPIPCEERNTDELSDAADFSQSKWQRTQHSSSAYDNSLFDLYPSAERDVYQKRDRGTPIIVSALISFYKIHNPQRIPFVYDIIRQYRSCTTELLTKLERKYKARCFFSCFYRLMRYPLSMEHIHREMVKNQENYETFGLHLRGIDAGGCEQGIFNLYDAEPHDSSSFSSSTLLNDLLELKEAACQVSAFLGDMEKRLSSFS